MEYNKIIAVTGMPGLYELLSSKSDGAIVRSLEDKSTKFVSSRIHNFSHLESIEIYTVRDNVNLVDVLKAMENSSEKLPDEKDNEGLKKYFTKVYPDLDFERVYASDLKKMIKWFSVLRNNQIEIKLSEPPVEEPAEAEPAEEPVKKTTAKQEKVEKPSSKAEDKAATVKQPTAKTTTPKEPTPPTREAAAKEKAAASAKEKATAAKPKAKTAEEEPKSKKPAAGKAAASSAAKPKKSAPKKKG